MHLVLFTHPSFTDLKSMIRFTNMLADGMKRRNHTVEVWSPKNRFFNLPAPKLIKKWLGYIDQYIVFPYQIRNRIRIYPPDTLFVITDNALGPWVPLVTNLPHVVHCHDFLAQRSAMGEIIENPTSWTGKKYQAFIRRGYQQSKNFISTSLKTENDLKRFLGSNAVRSEVVYNGLNEIFKPGNPIQIRTFLGTKIGIDLMSGYLLHVGGNQWYKNRIGVIDIYNAVRTADKHRLPLIMIGELPSADVKERYLNSPFKNSIYLLTDVDDDFVQLAYAGASVFLFPSLAEGFGWPIVEAMATGCPVITTDEAPMTEVAGEAGFLIPRRPLLEQEVIEWSAIAAKIVSKILGFSQIERENVAKIGFKNVQRFNSDLYLSNIERIYKAILADIYSNS